jgi:hypothetical protein
MMQSMKVAIVGSAGSPANEPLGLCLCDFRRLTARPLDALDERLGDLQRFRQGPETRVDVDVAHIAFVMSPRAAARIVR